MGHASATGPTRSLEVNWLSGYASGVIVPRPVREPLPTWLLLPAAVGGGLLATLAYAPFGLWPLAFIAVAALAWVVGRARRLHTAIGLGYLFGLAFMGTSLIWQTSIMILSYAGLTLVTALLYAGIAGMARITRRLPGAPVWGAAAWGFGEWVLSVFPFDGFMWMRLGYSQVDSPLAGFYPFTGAAFVSFLVALIGHLLAWTVNAVADRGVRSAPQTIRNRPPRTRTSGFRAGVTGATLLGLLGVGGLGTGWDAPRTTFGDVQVGWVQGGAPGGGVYGLGPARTITTNQAKQTDALMSEVEAGRLPAPDVVVWPENATDMDPRSDALTSRLVEGSVARASVPILVGSIYSDDTAEERQTVALWWTRDGVVGTYAKRNLVPFGEWIPFRSVLLPLIPELRYVGYQSVPGTEPGALAVTLNDGRALSVGVAICYEVIYPHTLYEAADAGAQLMVVQSSNAMYQGTIQIDQQFAVTRVRAAEMRTQILVVTTSGVSGRIGAHGEVLMRAPDHVGAAGVETMTLASTRTPAMVLGRLLEALVVLAGAASLALGALTTRGRASGGRMVEPPARVPGK